MTLEQLITWINDGKTFRTVDNGKTVTICRNQSGNYTFTEANKHGAKASFQFIEKLLPEILKPFAKE